MKKTYSPKLKLKIALEALKNDKTISQICQEYSVANSQVYKWKKQLFDEGSSIFENASVARTNAQTVEVERLYGQIGKLTVELNFAKKCAGL
ncbi:MAG: transposase [Methylophilaceae bacterium]